MRKRMNPHGGETNGGLDKREETENARNTRRQKENKERKDWKTIKPREGDGKAGSQTQ